LLGSKVVADENPSSFAAFAGFARTCNNPPLNLTCISIIAKHAKNNTTAGIQNPSPFLQLKKTKKKRTGAATNIIVPREPDKKNAKTTRSPNTNEIMGKMPDLFFEDVNPITPNKDVNCQTELTGII
jgi:hypothetical protein